MKIRLPRALAFRPAQSENTNDPAPGLGHLSALADFGDRSSDTCPRPITPSENLTEFLGRPPDKANTAQIRDIIRRLRTRLAEASDEARALSLPFDAVLLHELIDHLLTETKTTGHCPVNDGSVRAYFIDSLSEHLIQYPSNIFEIVTAADGNENYLPLAPETWAFCLTKLKETVQPQPDLTQLTINHKS